MKEGRRFTKDGVTVVVVTHARALLARAAIESVLAQRLEPLEILVIEDGSESGIELWIEQHGQHARLRYVRNARNVGLAASRNLGLQLARGTYVSFIDDDHVWLPEKLEQQVAALRRVGDGICAMTCGVVFDDGRRERQIPAVLRGKVRDEIGRRGLASIPDNAGLFRIDALRGIGGYDEELRSHTEYGLWMRMARAGLAADFVPDFLVREHEHDGPRLTTEFDLRSSATDRFLEKWQPAWRDWYGARRARALRVSLIRAVYTYMAGENLRHARYRVALKSYGQIWRQTPLSPTAHAAMGLCVARTLVQRGS